MTVHSLHIFDRKGKTLFTKRYVRENAKVDLEQQAEQRKLVFGMLFSLAQITASLSPTTSKSGIHSVKTGATSLYTFETTSGLRFALYVTNDDGLSAIRAALQHVYQELWIQCVTRSPLYTPTEPNVEATNFEPKLDEYLKSQTWFK